MKKTFRVLSFALSLVMLLSLLAGSAAHATDYPARAVQLVLGVAPGGDTDAYARLLAAEMSKTIGNQVIVTNMEGAGQSIGSTFVKNSPPDGYAVFFAHLPIIINYLFGVTDWNFDAMDLVCAVVDDQYTSMEINANNRRGWSSLGDVLDFARENPGEVSLGITAGSFSYLVALAFEDKAGVDLNLLDTGGSGVMNTMLLGEHLDIIVGSLASSRQFHESGDFLSTGVTAEERHPESPDVPTLKEQGVDLVVNKVFGFYFPKGTPQEVVDIFNASVEQAVMSEAFQELCKNYRTIARFRPREEAVEAIEMEFEFYKALLEGLTQ